MNEGVGQQVVKDALDLDRVRVDHASASVHGYRVGTVSVRPRDALDEVTDVDGLAPQRIQVAAAFGQHHPHVLSQPLQGLAQLGEALGRGRRVAGAVTVLEPLDDADRGLDVVEQFVGGHVCPRAARRARCVQVVGPHAGDPPRWPLDSYVTEG